LAISSILNRQDHNQLKQHSYSSTEIDLSLPSTFKMKFSATVLSTMLAATALAAPRGSAGIASRMQRRGFGARQSLPNKKSPTITNQTNVEYSENWSGAIITSPPSGETVSRLQKTKKTLIC
jgi:hypothetical protein